MSPSFASIMPQAVAVWCEELGHDVRYLCYSGGEDLTAHARDTDFLIVGAFTLSAFTAYATSNLFRREGAITALGGPHARCYPEDAARHFDYVLGFTDRPVLEEVLDECAPSRPLGRVLAAARNLSHLPSVAALWKFVVAILTKALVIMFVP